MSDTQTSPVAVDLPQPVAAVHTHSSPSLNPPVKVLSPGKGQSASFPLMGFVTRSKRLLPSIMDLGL